MPLSPKGDYCVLQLFLRVAKVRFEKQKKPEPDAANTLRLKNTTGMWYK